MRAERVCRAHAGAYLRFGQSKNATSSLSGNRKSPPSSRRTHPSTTARLKVSCTRSMRAPGSRSGPRGRARSTQPARHRFAPATGCSFTRCGGVRAPAECSLGEEGTPAQTASAPTTSRLNDPYHRVCSGPDTTTVATRPVVTSRRSATAATRVRAVECRQSRHSSQLAVRLRDPLGGDGPSAIGSPSAPGRCTCGRSAS